MQCNVTPEPCHTHGKCCLVAHENEQEDKNALRMVGRVRFVSTDEKKRKKLSYVLLNGKKRTKTAVKLFMVLMTC